jgi:transcriptional regulator with XRE-family HTH domain
MKRLTRLGVEVKRWLLDHRMTQRELAARLGVSEQYLSKILYGQKPVGKYLPALAETLGMGVDELKELAA